MPLVNEVVIPVGRKDEFNATKPQDDAKFLQFVTNPEVPTLIQEIYRSRRRRPRATTWSRCS